MTKIANNTQAVLLLTMHFSKPAKGDPEPLNINEWSRFSHWLDTKELKPADLLTGDPAEPISDWNDQRCSIHRIRSLLNRGTVLALAMEKWQRVGIWVLVSSDDEYPRRLKERLGDKVPPLLFGCGNKKILNTSGIGIVGSRNATDGDLEYARTLAKKLVDSGKTVISGGAKGIDEAAMLAAIEKEGTAAGILADSLFRAAISQQYRIAIQHKHLVLVSPFYPEAGFNVGNAMARNKYIYCMSDMTIVVHSGTTGGTWNGAIENLKKGWAPLLVKRTSDKRSGNAAIAQQGGKWLPEDLFESDFDAFLSKCYAEQKIGRHDIGQKVAEQQLMYQPAVSRTMIADDPGRIAANDEGDPLYMAFCSELRTILANGPVKQKELFMKFHLTESQMKAWLKRATDGGIIVKRNKALGYELADVKWHKQMSLFGDE